MTTTPDEHCPSCLGTRRAESLDVLPRFAHKRWCALDRAERETLGEDRARLLRRGTTTWHRAVTPAERTLVRAAGVALDERVEMFARIDWPTRNQRQRTFARAGLGVIDAVSS